MSAYTWLTELEFIRYAKVSDADMNEALQEVREVMPEWYISEQFFTKKRFLRKPIQAVRYVVYTRTIPNGHEVRYQSSACTKPTIMNLLYGLYMGYHRALKTKGVNV